MDESAILKTLQTGVIAAVAASTLPSIPVMYVDTEQPKPDDQKWLEVVWIPNNRTGDFWGSEKNYQGILRLVLHWPNVQSGSYTPLALIGSITDYFKVNRFLSGVEIYEIPDFTGILRDGDERLYPASIMYRSFRS